MQGAQHGTVSRCAVGCSLYMYIQAASKHALGSIVCVLPPPRKLSHSTFEGLLSLLLLLLAILLLQTPRTPLTLWREMFHLKGTPLLSCKEPRLAQPQGVPLVAACTYTSRLQVMARFRFPRLSAPQTVGTC